MKEFIKIAHMYENEFDNTILFGIYEGEFAMVVNSDLITVDYSTWSTIIQSLQKSGKHVVFER